MNAISNLNIQNLIISGYKAAIEAENEICARTQFNNPERNAALLNTAHYVELIGIYGLQKEVGLTYYNVWD